MAAGHTSDIQETFEIMEDSIPMSNNPKSSAILRVFALLAVSLAFFVGTAAAAQAATAAPAAEVAVVKAAVPVHQVAVPAPASWSCTNYFYSNGVERYCNVYSGYLRSYLSCSNGYTYYTAWVGTGYWHFLQVCPSGYSRVGSGVQSTG
jgi:hypothetical protein